MRTARIWVVALLTLLVVPGVVGFDVWPLTAWRLFSLSRDESQSEWALDARTPDQTRTVDLEELPMAYRNAAWVLDDVPGASPARRDAICGALLDAVREVVPGATGLRLVRERQRMRIVDGDPVVTARREVQHECDA